MTILDKLERRYSRYVPENITKILLIGQVLSYLLVYTYPQYGQYFYLSGRLLFQGQIWRLLTIIFAPVSQSLLFVIFAWYFFYMLGTALENQWGSFRYFVYILIGYLVTVFFALIFPDIPVTNVYIFSSLFLAFAHLYPDFQLLLFFIIPVKVKWLGYLTWLGLFLSFLSGPLPVKILIMFSVLNYFIFFYRDTFYTVRAFYRGITAQPKLPLQKKKPMHICAVCGRNEINNPDMEIRYCKQCFPETCYCGEHIKDHQHKRAVN